MAGAFDPGAFDPGAFDAGEAGAPEVEVTPILTLSKPGVPLDMYLDPITLDYVDTDDGEWLEIASAQTAVLIQCEQRLGKAWDSPGDGTEIKDLIESGDPLTPEVAAADTLRALQVMERDGDMIAEVKVAEVRDQNGELVVDEAGRPLIRTFWRDLASNVLDDATIPASAS